MYNFEPQVFDSLRKVPLYQNLIKETFERCLDLYLCPWVLKKRVNVAASALIPDIPNASDLKPFPTQISIEYKGHQSQVWSLSVSPCGKFLATGDIKGNLYIWDVLTSRIVKRYKFNTIDSVQWNPNVGMPVLAIANEQKVSILAPTKLFDSELDSNLTTLFRDIKQKHYAPTVAEGKKPISVWNFTDPSNEDYRTKDLRVELEFEHIIKWVRWHAKGDYFATLADNIQTSSQVLIHSLSKSMSQKPFSKTKGILETMEFHPTRPLFYICNDTHIFCYNLQKQALAKKF